MPPMSRTTSSKRTSPCRSITSVIRAATASNSSRVTLPSTVISRMFVSGNFAVLDHRAPSLSRASSLRRLMEPEQQYRAVARARKQGDLHGWMRRDPGEARVRQAVARVEGNGRKCSGRRSTACAESHLAAGGLALALGEIVIGRMIVLSVAILFLAACATETPPQPVWSKPGAGSEELSAARTECMNQAQEPDLGRDRSSAHASAGPRKRLHAMHAREGLGAGPRRGDSSSRCPEPPASDVGPAERCRSFRRARAGRAGMLGPLGGRWRGRSGAPPLRFGEPAASSRSPPHPCDSTRVRSPSLEVSWSPSRWRAHCSPPDAGRRRSPSPRSPWSSR